MKKFLVIGDSHTIFFEQLEKISQLIDNPWGVRDYVLMTRSSSTIRGLRNQPSTLSMREQIEEFIGKVEKPEIIVFAFGQVDTELGFYYRKSVKGEQFSVDEFIAETIAIYKTYLEDIKARHGVKIVIKGVNPTLLINDAYAAGYVGHTTTAGIQDAEKRAMYKQKVMDEMPDYAFRFDLNKRLNDALKRLATELDAKYFDIWDQVLDEDAGVVHNKYIPAPWDHHLADNVAVRKIHYDALYEAMKELF